MFSINSWARQSLALPVFSLVRALRLIYNRRMKRSPLIHRVIAVILATGIAGYAADSPNFAGEYADKKFMSGQAVLQLSLEQQGKKVAIFFSGVRNDGQGAAPEFNTGGTVSSKGIVEFKFEDDLKNSGTGTISRAGDDVVLSIKPTHVVDPRAVRFYGQNMRLKRVKK